MKPLPAPDDPYALQARIMDAVIGDLFDMASGQATEARRWNAMREIRKQSETPKGRERGQ
jgi:hypothetical protein